MSVRRRAIRERVERDKARRRGWEKLSTELTALSKLLGRKIAAGEKTVSIEEINACFTVSE